MIVKNFSIFINENIASIFNYTRTYTDDVSSSLIDVIMRANSISEKDFKRVNNVMSNVKDLLQNNKEVKDIIAEYDADDKRAEFCAEYIYHYIVNKNKNK
jgi:hypothetical protein